MKNYDAKLKMVNKRLKKRPLINPEFAIHQISKFIDMSCCDLDGEMKNIRAEERITLYEFVYMANYDLMLCEALEDQDRKTMWAELEKGIRENNGFKPDDKDELALKIKLF